MATPTPDALRGLAADIEAELKHLHLLEEDIAQVRQAIASDAEHARLFYENLALKLHNFYTGCERIFRMVVSELNGGQPSGYDWHRRLLERMGMPWQERPPLLSAESIAGLREYLAFRHVVRNIYGYELDTERVEHLIERYPQVWRHVENDVQEFINWLREFADQLERIGP
ncbi:MAG: hypothetical protein GXP42_04545 [Chloroflexi bacterium]|nr:hypothetical protein [Chloroflexota bacterium]